MSRHCDDCCCARSWKALGISDYTGRSIPEEIEALREQVKESKAQRDHLRRTIQLYSGEVCRAAAAAEKRALRHIKEVE